MLKSLRRPFVKEYIFQRFLQNNIDIGFSYSQLYNNHFSPNPNNNLYNLVKNIDIIDNNRFNIVYTKSESIATKCAMSYAKNTNNAGLVFVNKYIHGYMDLVKPIMNITRPIIFVNLFYNDKKYNNYNNYYTNSLSSSIFSDIITINKIEEIKPSLDFLLNTWIKNSNSNANSFFLSIDNRILHKNIDTVDTVDMLDDESELQYFERKYRNLEEHEYKTGKDFLYNTNYNMHIQ